jgi:glycosyltransferase involved in cell wall biosynthesis
VVIVAARNEADRIGATLDALADALPGARLWVADDASSDATRTVALARGATVVSRSRSVGKGGNVTAAAVAALPEVSGAGIVLICDGDLGGSAARLGPLAAAVADGECDLAVAAFRHREGGGFGAALGFARWAIERRCDFRAGAPISGQRALRARLLRRLLPLAPGYGIEIGMTIDAVRAGAGVRELELDLEHRATGPNAAGFVHRARQLRDFVRVYLSR